jgi:isopenicillin N synthase-like dioxygenase
MKLRNSCCCSPYPVVDLTEAFQSHKNLDRINVIKEQVTAACERYGCFHVTVRLSSASSSSSSSSADLSNSLGFNIFQDEEQVRKTFQSIFRQEMTSSVASSSSFQSEEEEVENSQGRQPINGTTTLSSSSYCCSVSSFPRDDGSMSAARYRGRSAESGSSTGMEPKQSWEIFHCRNILPAASSSLSTKNTTNDTTTTTSRNKEDLGILYQYMKVLHQVSVCLVRDILELPYFVESNTCQCDNRPNTNEECCTDHFCSMDLLRAFQYDAVEPSQVLCNLGSSPHTDWGSLTVVWQDSKGGLQIYCHEHQIWNDVGGVVLSKGGSHGSGGGDDGQEGLVRFFIHVGDFTSLVMNHNHGYKKDDDDEEEYVDRLIWPSPLHRVLCPTLDEDGQDDHGQDDGDVQDDGDDHVQSSSRCSLVYFAYPAKGLSLENVQKFVTKKCLDQDSSTQPLLKYDVPYERFMVLNDQSKGGDGTAAMEPEEVYQRIASIPFHQVIQDKWKQVQR